jgi:hypothetical protein
MRPAQLLALALLLAIGGFVFYAAVSSGFDPWGSAGFVLGLGALVFWSDKVPQRERYEFLIGIGLCLPIALPFIFGSDLPRVLLLPIVGMAMFGCGILSRVQNRLVDPNRPKKPEK